MTGGRLKRVQSYIKNEDSFCFTYGDGVGNIDIGESINFHKAHGKYATMTATYAPGRFGALDIEDGVIKNFQEKPKGDGAMINGGFFVLNQNVFDFIKDDSTLWEEEPLMNLAKEQQLMAFEHKDFWQPMDTVRDKQILENLWQSDKAPWKTW
jgi:glucose-1-phosphate cytidylyltransferase